MYFTALTQYTMNKGGASCIRWWVERKQRWEAPIQSHNDWIFEKICDPFRYLFDSRCIKFVQAL